MAYSDLIPKPTILSLADDGSQFVATDSTGLYPEEAGGYAPEGSGTATRPSYSETKRFFCFQQVPFEDDGNLVAPFLPEDQPQADPFVSTCSLLDEFGVPLPQKSYRGILFIVPAATDLDAMRDDIATNGIDAMILNVLETGAVGIIGILIQQPNIICVNQSRRVAIDNLVKDACCFDAFDQKNAELQGIIMTLGLYPNYDIISEDLEALFEETDSQIDQLNTVCLKNPCCANCQ